MADHFIRTIASKAQRLAEIEQEEHEKAQGGKKKKSTKRKVAGIDAAHIMKAVEVCTVGPIRAFKWHRVFCSPHAANTTRI